MPKVAKRRPKILRQVLLAALAPLLVACGEPTHSASADGCRLSEPVRVGPGAGSLSIAGGAGALYLLGSAESPRAGLPDAGPFLLALDGDVEDLPPVPREAYGLRGGVRADGSLEVFWATGDSRSGGAELHHTRHRGSAWVPVELIASGLRLGPEGMSAPVQNGEDVLHIGAAAAEDRLLRPVVIFPTEQGWRSVPLSAWGGYVCLAELAGGAVGALFVGTGSGEDAGVGPGIEYLELPRSSHFERVGRPTRVSGSGRDRDEFVPVLLSSEEFLHAAWARDSDGNPLSWEQLWVSHSSDGGRSWSRERLVDSGGHIMKVRALHLSGQPHLLYLWSSRFGGPAEVRLTRIGGSGRHPPVRLRVEEGILELVVRTVGDRSARVAFSVSPTPHEPLGVTYHAFLDCDG